MDIQSIFKQLQLQMSRNNNPQVKMSGGEPCIFDATKYSNKYTDLQKAFNGDAGLLKKHFIEYGLNEGRTPCGDIDAQCKFDAKTFISLNPDLRKLPDPTQYYKERGINEGRVVCAAKKHNKKGLSLRPSVTKDQKRVELNMAKADVKVKQAEYDKLTPEEAIKRKTDEANKEANEYINGIQTKMNYETELYNTTLSEIESLSNSPAFILAQKYKSDLSKKYQEVASENSLHKEAYITNRRRFLDANPHESMKGVGWFTSIDDRILLFFWFCFLLFGFSVISFFIIGSNFGSMLYKSGLATISLVAGVLLVHFGIKKFGGETPNA